MRTHIGWGEVIDDSASPPEIRWAGESADQPVPLGLDGWTPANGDKVLLFTVGGRTVAVPFVAL